MNNDLNSNSRSGYRAKRKKTNLVLNSLIVIVLLLILFVAYKIFVSGSDAASSKKETPITTEKKTAQQKEQKDTPKKSVKKQQTSDNTSTEAQKEQNQQNSDKQQSNDTSSTNQADGSQAVVSDGGSSANVLKTIENPAWKPVGTSQTGSHTPVYSTESVDWQEMLNAISYATGLEQSNMIVQFLGRDKSAENASVGTVYSRDKQQKYTVYIKWVDNEGWQPTKVEELSKIQ